jgi:hypothetical protein
VQGRSRPARSSGLFLALALLCLLAVFAPAALARERVQPPRELVRQYPLESGKTRLKSGERPASRPLAAADGSRAVAAGTQGDDGGAMLPGFLLIGLGVAALAAGALWVVRAPSSAPELAPVATPVPAAPLRATASPAASRRGPKPRPARGSPASRGGGSVKDQPALQQRIAEMRRSGMTLQAIADTLNDEGVPTVRGGARWRPSSVQTAAGYKRPGAGAKQR